MDRFVARLNIEHLRQALATETDHSKRQTLARLLSNEEAKLAAALEKTKKTKDDPTSANESAVRLQSTNI